MRQITDIKELRELQMQILDRIHAFCQEHNLTYFLSSGTLIGAVRHGGYIPWDDDIDIHMPRESYTRFRQLFNDNNTRYKLIDAYNTDRYYYTFPKVVDTHTSLIEHGVSGTEIGIYVDIFPVDFVPDNLDERKKVFSKKNRLKRYLIALQKNIFCTLNPAGILFRIWARIRYSRIKLIKEFDRIITRYSGGNQICNLTDSGPQIEGCFNASAISDSIDIKFEDRVYKTMIGYQEYLSLSYGDYMTLPPENQRVHHDFTAYLREE